jgi:circadian clock protein KaiC
MRSIGMDLSKHVKSGLLLFHAARPTMYGLEMHLVQITKLIREFKPKTVVIDPITNLITVGTATEVQSILNRLLDYLQVSGITAVFTGLTPTNNQDDEIIASLVDTWIHVKDIEMNGERNRGLYIMKSRGIKHSNQVREFIITDRGLVLQDVYLGPDGVLTGSAREAHKLQMQEERQLQQDAAGKNEKEVLRKEKELELKIQALKNEFESLKDNLAASYSDETRKKQIAEDKKQNLLRYRSGAAGNSKAKK